jgi:hypothetical protein
MVAGILHVCLDPKTLSSKERGGCLTAQSVLLEDANSLDISEAASETGDGAGARTGSRSDWKTGFMLECEWMNSPCDLAVALSDT